MRSKFSQRPLLRIIKQKRRTRRLEREYKQRKCGQLAVLKIPASWEADSRAAKGMQTWKTPAVTSIREAPKENNHEGKRGVSSEETPPTA